MNERLKQLEKQCWSTRVQGRLVDGQLHFDIEKFAELIVRECVDLCEHESNDDEYDQYDMGMSVKAEDIKASIMKTFGVK